MKKEEIENIENIIMSIKSEVVEMIENIGPSVASKMTGLSISYLSEMKLGKKPTSYNKIIDIAKVLLIRKNMDYRIVWEKKTPDDIEIVQADSRDEAVRKYMHNRRIDADVDDFTKLVRVKKL
jgi:hypothetical protein